MPIKFFSVILILVFSQVLRAQELENENINIFSIIENRNEDWGKVYIYQDDRIENLVNQHIEHNIKQPGIPGFRINIFFESGLHARQQAETIRDTFMYYFPDVPCYLEYQAPNFKVYVGDYRTKVDALKFFKQINKKYPKSFPVSTMINYPKTD
jgi:hypothetical protein